MNQYKEQLDKMIWSYSRVSSYDECPYQFKLVYIDKAEKTGNAYAQWGSLCHSIFERYLKGELELYELVDVYKAEYKKYVTMPFAYNEVYYENGIDVFSSFDGLPNGIVFLESEKRFFTEINGKKFLGIIDVIARDSADNGIIVQDYKSKSKFKSKKEKTEYARQLYLYAHYIEKTYNEFPKLLRFDMFRSKQIVDIPFDKDAFDDANKWFVNTIQNIYNDEYFNPKPKKEIDYYCENLCDVREICPYRREEML